MRLVWHQVWRVTCVCRQPSVVEIQILRVGQFVILCVPGELTTMAGRRLREAVQASVPPILAGAVS